MSYRCDACGAVTPRGRPRLTHAEYKPGRLRQIARELALCQRCHDRAKDGDELADLVPPPIALCPPPKRLD